MTSASISITMREWERHGPNNEPRLQGTSLTPSDRDMALRLRQSALLEVTELKSGLEIRSFSHVGRIRLGTLDVRIIPKVPQPTLLNLLRYAFGFRQLRLFEDVRQALETAAFEDLLVYQLNAEAGELIARGLHREYEVQHATLSSPRGRIDMLQLVRQGGVVTARLPCRFFPRIEDCAVNRVLLTGLKLAAAVANDEDLRRRSQRLAEQLIAGRVSSVRLDPVSLAQVHRGMNRLTVAYEPAVNLIELLVASHGFCLRETSSSLHLPGFLFDMNRFFQALVSRFLHEYLCGYTVQDEVPLRGMIRYVPEFNPRCRHAPVLRPDVIVLKGRAPVAVLDAKYRDLWEENLPSEMLYQVATYAVIHAARTAVILYPTTSTNARESRLAVHNALTGDSVATVCLRPVLLPELEELLTAALHGGERPQATHPRSSTGIRPLTRW
jgi:5-methylcytosine-specific restriction enzyme subunit McrC